MNLTFDDSIMSSSDNDNQSSPLLRPLTLSCGLVLPNRLVKAAMTEAMADNFGRPTDQLCRLYECWAKQEDGVGVGVLLTGNIQVDRRYVESPGNVCIDKYASDYDDDNAESMDLLKKFAQSGRRIDNNGNYKCLMMAQLSHAGRQSNGMVNMSPVGPGNIGLEDLPGGGKASFGTPRPLEVHEIGVIVERFVYAATKCQEAGFDGIQIHAAHGYLFSAFLNPRANNRHELFGDDDPYGGSLENRARLLLTVVRRIKEATQATRSKFAVSVKLNSADFQQGGFTTQEAVQVARWLEESGIDFLELSGGNYETGVFACLTLQDQQQQQQQRKRLSTIHREAYFLEYALEIQSALKDVPVMVTGGWRTRVAMEAALERGDCALIGIGRPMCGDPACGARLLAGQSNELPCYETELPANDLFLKFCSTVCCCRLKIGGLLQMMALQGWFYRQLFRIADTGHGDPNMGIWSAMIANMKHERDLAKNLQGDVDCVGQVYKGLPSGRKS